VNYQHRVADFIDDHLRLPVAGKLKLTPVQRAIVEGAFAREGDRWRFLTATLLHSKGSGKSTLMGAALVHRLVCFPQSISYCLSQSERQAVGVVFRTAKEIAAASFRGIVLGGTQLTNPENGSVVVALPRSYRSCEGMRPRSGLFVCDELHRFEAEPSGVLDSLGSPFDLMMSQLDDPESQGFFGGQLGTVGSQSARLKELHDAGELERSFLDYRTDALEVNPRLDPAIRERARKTLPDYLFKVLHECATAETAGSYFPAELVDAALAQAAPYTLPLTNEDWQAIRHVYGPSWTVTAGLDRSMGHAHSDATVLTAVGRPNVGFAPGAFPFLVLGCHVFDPGHEAEDILDKLTEWRHQFGRFWRVTFEAYQAMDLARAAGRSGRVELVHATVPNQTNWFHTILQALRDGRLFIPGGEAGERLASELKGLTVEVRPDLTAKFSGRPDDSAFALGHAMFAFRDRNEAGTQRPEAFADERERREKEAERLRTTGQLPSARERLLSQRHLPQSRRTGQVISDQQAVRILTGQ